MTTIERLTDSCLLVTEDHEATLFDPGFHTYNYEGIQLDSIGDVTRVLVTHEHGDHVSADFVRWLTDRRHDLVIHSNDAVRALLAPHSIDVDTDAPDGVSFEDVRHEMVPSGDTPPNRSFTIDGVLTHPGDSRQATRTAPVMAAALMAPWGSMTGAVEFIRRVRPEMVVPVHDFYLSDSGRKWVRGAVAGVLKADGIEVVDLDWGESLTI